MRLWHLLALVAAVAVVLTLMRSPLGLMLLVGMSWLLLMMTLDSVDRWIRIRHPGWPVPPRGMLVLAGGTLIPLALVLVLVLVFAYLGR